MLGSYRRTVACTDKKVCILDGYGETDVADIYHIFTFPTGWKWIRNPNIRYATPALVYGLFWCIAPFYSE